MIRSDNLLRVRRQRGPRNATYAIERFPLVLGDSSFVVMIDKIKTKTEATFASVRGSSMHIFVGQSIGPLKHQHLLINLGDYSYIEQLLNTFNAFGLGTQHISGAFPVNLA